MDDAPSLGPRRKRIRLWSHADKDKTAASRCRWTELPADLLREVSRRLQTATNYVRFHAVCKPWRATLLPRDHSFSSDRFNVSLRLRRPGDTTWTLVETNLTTTHRQKGRCSVAYYGGKTVLCHGMGAWCIANNRSWWKAAPVDDAHERCVSSYVLESRGELLWVVVQAKSRLALLDFPDADVVVDSTVGSRLATGLSVSVHALQEKRESETSEPLWEKRDGRSFADRSMFLGVPTSSAVDVSDEGCAYFVTKRRILFKYSFRDGKSEFIEQLPGEWDDASCSWITPQPAFECAAPTELGK